MNLKFIEIFRRKQLPLAAKDNVLRAVRENYKLCAGKPKLELKDAIKMRGTVSG